MSPSPSMIGMLEEEEAALAASFLDGGGDRSKPYFYLAGPMSGHPQFNFPAFFKAAENLRTEGYNVVNPAELDEEIERHEAMKSPDGAHGSLDHVKTWRQCLRRDVDIVLDDNCAGIILLEGWEQSKGARMETYNAAAVDVPLYEYFQDDELGEYALIIIERSEALEEAGIKE